MLNKIFYKALYKMNFLNNKDKYFSYYKKYKQKYKELSVNEMKKYIDFKLGYLANTAIPAMSLHKEVFTKYKNINKGKNVVLMGSGPTLNDYVPIEGAVHIGVNNVFQFDKVKLDYIFIQDYLLTDEIQNAADSYIGNDCKKFYGIHQLHYWDKHCKPVSESSALKANAERYFFNDLQIGHSPIWGFAPDITLMPLTTYSSVIFPALQFALFTHPKKIYIVGCDCSSKSEHFFESTDENSSKEIPSLDNILYGWSKAESFAKRFYPEVEIVLINPIGLKGFFTH